MMRRRIRFGIGNIDFQSTDFQNNVQYITVPAQSYNYTGSEIRPTISMSYKNTLLREGVDYAVSYANNIKPSKSSFAYLYVDGIGDFYGRLTFIFTINTVPITVNDVVINNNQPCYYKNNVLFGTAEFYPLDVITIPNVYGLTRNDYDLYYNDAKITNYHDTTFGTVGNHTITIKSDYFNDITYTYEVLPIQVSSSSYSIYYDKTHTYNSTYQDVSLLKSYVLDTNQQQLGTLLRLGTTEFDLSQYDVKNPGDYTITVTFKHNHAGSLSFAIHIDKYPITPVVASANLVYNGTYQTPAVVSQSVIPDGDQISYEVVANAIDVGTYTATVSLPQQWSNIYELTTNEVTFNITPLVLTVPVNRTYPYNGTHRTYEPTTYETITVDGVPMSEADIINAGSITVVSHITNNNVKWSDGTTSDKTFTITITRVDIADVDCTIEDQYYTGNPIVPTYSVTYDYLALTLIETVDYTASYADNTNVGVATAILTGTGNFTGTKVVSFNIVYPVLVLADPNDPIRFAKAESDNSWTLNISHTSYNSTDRICIYNVHSQTHIYDLLVRFANNIDSIYVYKGTTRVLPKYYSTTNIITGHKIVLEDSMGLTLDTIYVCVVGDIDGDGIINTTDSTYLRQIIIGRKTVTYEAWLAADINKDGIIDNLDFQLISAKLNGTSDFEADYEYPPST